MDDKELLILGSESGRNPYASTTFRIIPEVSSSETNGNILLPIHKTLVLYRERLRRFYRLHGLTLFSAFLTMLSSAGILLFFPLHLKEVTRSDSDGYCAALVITSLSTVLFIIIAVLIRGYSWISGRLRLAVTLSTPSVSWSNIVKIGVSSGLSILTVCYAWEEHKVICNLQIPLLGFVFVFAAITHAISRWRDFGMRRSFALLSVISGIFLSVNYAILDHERCRGVHPPPRDIWTWKVHLVWTLAFLVALWLWTVAIFSIESAIPLPHKRIVRKPESGYRMQVLKPVCSGKVDSFSMIDPEITKTEVYPCVPLISVFRALLWFQIGTWIVIMSLFWTEFVPGFGKAIREEDLCLGDVITLGLLASVQNLYTWGLLFSQFLFAHAFTHFILSVESALVGFGIASLGLPIAALWWSLFQIQRPMLIWLPLMSEVICASAGFPLILGGSIFLLYLERSQVQFLI